MTIELSPPLLELATSHDADGGAPFDVRSFAVNEAISTLFQVRLTAHHTEPSIDFEPIVGAPAAFRLTGHGLDATPTSRVWTGLVSSMEQTRAVGGKRAYSTYELVLVPKLWLLTQRRNYRIFQFKSEVEIALILLNEWGITHQVRLDVGAYRGRKYKVQYAETDFEFIYRILSEVGVCFFFETVEGVSTMILHDAPHLTPRLPLPLDFEDSPNFAGGKSFVSNLHRSQRIRPAKVLLRDRDYRKDSTYELQAGAKVVDDGKKDLAIYDQRMELFYYPENFNFVDDGESASSDTPHADDRGLSRTDEKEAKRLAIIDLAARRNDSYVVELDSNDIRLTHGVVFAVNAHPAEEINHEKGFLIVESRIGGRIDTAVQVSVEAVSARWGYRPTLAAKPRIIGLESATVVGVHGEEIDCDEFGRVRVHFHWDRYSQRDEKSSCWIPVSQTWGGAGMGGVQIPRIGQEVLVEFLAGDPDRPIVTGRVFTAVNKVPLKLPQAKTQTTLQSQSTGGGGGHNMIRMEDNCGLEEIFIRAQKDMNAKILNNYDTWVGNDRSATVIGHDSHTTTKTSTVKSGESMTLNAGTKGAHDLTATATQSISVIAEKAVEIKAKYENMTLTAALALNQNADTMMVTVNKKFVLRVGASCLILTPSYAILHSPETFINPGVSDAAAALHFDQKPKSASDVQAEKAAADKVVADQKSKEFNDNYKQVQIDTGRMK